MSTDNPPSGPPGGSGRRRGPTIELEATEVASTAPDASPEEPVKSDMSSNASGDGAPPPPGADAPKARGRAAPWGTISVSAVGIVLIVAATLLASQYMSGSAGP